jgi:papain like cysteine protease AvrRpt2
LTSVLDTTRVPISLMPQRPRELLPTRGVEPADTGQTLRVATDWDRLDFAVQHQQQTLWCWAAVSVSVACHFDPQSSQTQCGLASMVLGVTGCCESAPHPDCNQSYYLDQALTAVGAFDHRESAPAPLDVVRGEIRGGRPVGTRVGWPDGTGHFIVLEGCREDGAYVAVEDPWYGASDLAPEVLTSGYQGTGTWTHTYYTRAPSRAS